MKGYIQPVFYHPQARNGNLCVFIAGGTTKTNLFDPLTGQQISNPVPINSEGVSSPFHAADTNLYDLVFSDAFGNVVESRENVMVIGATQGGGGGGDVQSVTGNIVDNLDPQNPIVTLPDVLVGITTGDVDNWNTAFGWGNHATAGYALQSELGDYVPFTGADKNVDLGAFGISARSGLFVNPDGTGNPLIARNKNGTFIARFEDIDDPGNRFVAFRAGGSNGGSALFSDGTSSLEITTSPDKVQLNYSGGGGGIVSDTNSGDQTNLILSRSGNQITSNVTANNSFFGVSAGASISFSASPTAQSGLFAQLNNELNTKGFQISEQANAVTIYGMPFNAEAGNFTGVVTGANATADTHLVNRITGDNRWVTRIVASHAVYVSKEGNDASTGLSTDRAKLTIASAITAASTLLGAGATGVRIEVMDGGAYAGGWTVPDKVVVFGPAAHITGGITISAGGEVWVDKHVSNANNQNLVDMGTASDGGAVYYANFMDGRPNTGVTLVRNVGGGGKILFTRIAIAHVGASGIGYGGGTGGFGHVHIETEDLYLSGNNAVGIDAGNVGANAANMVGMVHHIISLGGTSGTTAIRVSNASATAKMVCSEIIADTAYSITAGSLYLSCPRIVGTRTGTPLGLLSDVEVRTGRVSTPELRATTSAGILVEASNGTDVGILGAGNTANVAWLGAHTFAGLVSANGGLAVTTITATGNVVVPNSTTATHALNVGTGDGRYGRLGSTNDWMALNSFIGNATDVRLASRTATDDLSRWIQQVDGAQGWGPGGATTRDVWLWRSGVGVLSVGTANNNSSGLLAVGTATADTHALNRGTGDGRYARLGSANNYTGGSQQALDHAFISRRVSATAAAFLTRLEDDAQFRWYVQANGFQLLGDGTNIDTYFGRDSAGVLRIGTNSSNSSGSLLLGNLTASGKVQVGASDWVYFGPDENGGWRVGRSGNNLVHQRKESGTWVTKQTINA